MTLAQKISLAASQVTGEDIENLRRFGLSDTEILDVVLACTARNFFSKTLDTLEVPPDTALLNMEPELVQALTIGRPLPLAGAI